jgi:hypothetical protein
MTDNIITFPGLTTLDIEPDHILEAAANTLQVVIVCGLDKDGNTYLAASTADAATVTWHLQRAIWAIMQLADEE